jgi:hypothetical protein
MIPRPALAALAIAALVGGFAACGDDDDPAASSEPGADTTSEPAADTTSEPAADTTGDDAPTTTGETGAPADTSVPAGADADSEFCVTLDDAVTFANEFETPEDDTEFEDAKAAVLEGLEGLHERYEAALEVAPSEIESDLSTFTDYLASSIGVLEDAESEDEANEAFAEPPSDVQSAQENLDAYAREQCGLELGG